MPVFEYTGYRNPYGPSIAEALAHQADPQAAAALRSGDIAAHAAQQQGALRAQQFSALGAIPGEIQAQQDRALARSRAAQQQQIGAQQLQGGALALEDAQAKRAAEARIGKLLEATPRGANGTYDLRAFTGQLAGDDMKYAQPYIEHLNAVNAAWESEDTKRRGQMQQGAAALLQAGAPFLPTQNLIDTAERDRVLTADQATTARRQLLEDPAGALGVLRTLMGPQKIEFHGLDQQGIDPTGRVVVPARGKPGEGDYTINGVRFHADGTQVGPAVPLQTPPAAPGAGQHVINGQLVGPGGERIGAPVPKQIDPTTAGDVTALSPAGLDAAALNYAKTGLLPPLGMGDKTTRKQIINRAAEMMPGLDVASAKADYTANTQSLQAMQKQRDAIGAFEQTARKNIDIFLDAAGKVVDTGSPLANSLVRQVSGKMLGSPDQAAYDAARQVAVNEIAKIVSNPTLAGTLSDSARHEVDAFNPGTATLAQSVRVMRLLKQDMDNRTSALDDAIGGIKSRIKQGAPETGGGGGVKKDPLGLFP